MDELNLTFVDQTIEKVGTGTEKVLEILPALQGHYGYLPKEALERVCEQTEITPATITGVSTFYDQFRHQPAGQHIIHVCVGTACHVVPFGRPRQGDTQGGHDEGQSAQQPTGANANAAPPRLEAAAQAHFAPGFSSLWSDSLRPAHSEPSARPA